MMCSGSGLTFCLVINFEYSAIALVEETVLFYFLGTLF
jgi:hypothetical protein